MAEFKTNEMIEDYKVLVELGRGAASIVYLVQEPGSQQIWALKHVEKHTPKDQRFLDQAEAEYKIAQHFDHGAIRKIPKLIKKGKLLSTKELYLVMEFVDGISEEKQAPRTVEQVVGICEQVAKGLAHMHGRGFVHADMKPNNIMVHEGVAKIIDLGQSCKIGTVKERIQGTPDYIAPEQVHRRAITPKTDIYNLGATMYWMLTRRNIPTALAKGDSLVSSLDEKLMEKPAPVRELNPRVPGKLDELVMLCLNVDPEKRPESMSIVADRLNLILGIIRMEEAKRAAALSRSKMGIRPPDSSAD